MDLHSEFWTLSKCLEWMIIFEEFTKHHSDKILQEQNIARHFTPMKNYPLNEQSH